MPGDMSLIQLGTEQDVGSDGSTDYYAWYELVSNDPSGLQIPLDRTQYPVSPGDLITATIQCIAACMPNVQQTWKLTMTNSTKGWTWPRSQNETLRYTASLASAEWIMEATEINGAIAALPSFSAITFSNATANGGNAGFTPSDEIIMDDQNGGAVTPSAPIGGNAFTVNYVGTTPPDIPFPPSPGSLTCTGGSDLGDLTVNNSAVINGTAQPNYEVSFRFYMRQYFFVEALPRSHPQLTYSIVDDVTGRAMAVILSNNVQLSLDPGYYCFKVGTVASEPVPFRVNLFTYRAGFVPAPEKARALPVAQLELGSFSENGYYATTRYERYLQGQPPSIPLLLEANHSYVLRDWIGSSTPAQWYRFDLDKQRKVTLDVYNLYLSANVIIENERGTIVGVTSTAGISPIKNLLAERFLGILSPGTYYLHINFANAGTPGTSFGLALQAQ